MAKLAAEKRENFTRASLTKIRSAGAFPAIIYGKGAASEPVAVDETQFIKVIREVGRNGMISLDVNGQTYDVVLQDFQQDPLKGHIVHADFLAVDSSSEITAHARIDVEGEAPGVKEGGVIQQPLHEVNVTAAVSDFPEHITVNVSNLSIGDSLTVGDIRSQFNFTIEHEDEETIVSILPPQKMEEPDLDQPDAAMVPSDEDKDDGKN